MANYYTQFSAVLKLNAREAAWCAARYRELRARRDAENDFDLCEFELDFDGCEAWFHADESGTPAHVADFVQSYMQRFKKRTVWKLEWADTCGSAKLDAFGGGAVVVTAKKQYWMSTAQWAQQTVNKLQRSGRA